jgi:hypothetical protein
MTRKRRNVIKKARKMHKRGNIRARGEEDEQEA